LISILHTVISLSLFYGIGLALFATWNIPSFSTDLRRCLAAIGAFSIGWLHYFRQGPLEWVWRSLIYGALQSGRRIKVVRGIKV
jgi:uncharacterized protein